MKLLYLTRIPGGDPIAINPHHIISLEPEDWDAENGERLRGYPERWTRVLTMGGDFPVKELLNDPVWLGGNASKNPKLLKLAADYVNVKRLELAEMVGEELPREGSRAWTAFGHLATDIKSLAGYVLGELPDDPAGDDAKPEPVAIREAPRKSQARKPGRG